MNGSQPHRWRFFRLGGFDQVRLETAEDIQHLDELDQKLWAALSCPVHGLEFDPRTLAMLDTDTDGRVRVPEVLAAARWVTSLLKDKTPLLSMADTLPLAAIDATTPEGKGLLASAKQILAYLGKPTATSISIADLAGTETLLHDSKLNGDGVVTPASTDDAALSQLIGEIMACEGTVNDRSGAPGIGVELVTAFFDAATKYAAWWDEALANSQVVLPLGDKTSEAAAVLQSVRSKINDYFTRCALATYDPKAQEPLNPASQTYEILSPQDLTAATAELERFPLARIESGRPLPLTEGLNPAWSGIMASLQAMVIKPLLGETNTLEPGQWKQIQAAFAPYEAWQAAKAGPEVESLGIDRIRTILAGGARQDLDALIAADLSLAEQIDSIEAVVRLVHYTRDLLPLLNNFVAFRDFYVQDRKAIFQAGTLYLDGRACELCVRVDNPDAHGALANLSQTYLAYCQCKRRGSSEQMTIAAAFTGGDADNLMVGRNGVFYDRKGGDWDATIVKIIDHPISVRQAFWAPYKRVARMITTQIEKFAASKDRAVDAGAEASIASAPATPQAAKAPFDVGKFAGIFAAIGLALGAIGTAVATVLGGFMSLPLWQMPLAIAGIILFISGPSMLMAYMKLRQRNLGPILDACGWAVNTKASINIPFGTTLTKVAELPKGAERSLSDPFAEKKTPWTRWAVILAILVALGMAWDKGYIQKLTKSVMPMLIKEQVNATVDKPAAPAASVQQNATAPAPASPAEPAK